VSGGKSIRANCSSQQGRDSQSNNIAFHLNNYWLPRNPLDKRIGRRHHRNSHGIVRLDVCARGRDHHHTIEESAFKDLTDEHKLAWEKTTETSRR
jgi:hypothetical protein